MGVRNMPKIYPTVGDYVRFVDTHTYRRNPIKRVGRVISVTGKKVTVRFWIDAFYGFDAVSIPIQNATYIEKPIGYEIPMNVDLFRM